MRNINCTCCWMYKTKSRRNRIRSVWLLRLATHVWPSACPSLRNNHKYLSVLNHHYYAFEREKNVQRKLLPFKLPAALQRELQENISIFHDNWSPLICSSTHRQANRLLRKPFKCFPGLASNFIFFCYELEILFCNNWIELKETLQQDVK